MSGGIPTARRCAVFVGLLITVWIISTLFVVMFRNKSKQNIVGSNTFLESVTLLSYVRSPISKGDLRLAIESWGRLTGAGKVRVMLYTEHPEEIETLGGKSLLLNNGVTVMPIVGGKVRSVLGDALAHNALRSEMLLLLPSPYTELADPVLRVLYESSVALGKGKGMLGQCDWCIATCWGSASPHACGGHQEVYPDCNDPSKLDARILAFHGVDSPDLIESIPTEAPFSWGTGWTREVLRRLKVGTTSSTTGSGGKTNVRIVDTSLCMGSDTVKQITNTIITLQYMENPYGSNCAQWREMFSAEKAVPFTHFCKAKSISSNRPDIVSTSAPGRGGNDQVTATSKPFGVTMFSSPKPMNDSLVARVQRNAVRSWTMLVPRPQILLYGDEWGISDLCKELNVTHVPELKMIHLPGIASSAALGWMFRHAYTASQYDILIFINTDILLPRSIMYAAWLVSQQLDKFLVIGHRYRVDVDKDIVTPEDLAAEFEKCKEDHDCRQDIASAVDYFLFSKPTYSVDTIPDFAVGRPAYDNWLVHRVVHSHIPVIICDRLVHILHQNHHYKHLGAEADMQDRPLHHNPGKEYNYALSKGEWYHGYLFHNNAVLKVRNSCIHKTWYDVGPDCEYYLMFLANPKIVAEHRFPKYSCRNASMCMKNYADNVKSP